MTLYMGKLRRPSAERSLTGLTKSGIVPQVAAPGNISAKGGPDSAWRRVRRWLQPGLGVKRWLLLMIVGTAFIGLGLAFVLLGLYRAHPDSFWMGLLSLNALPRWGRVIVLSLTGLAFLILGFIQLNRSLLAPYIRPGRPVVEAIAAHRRLGRGPRVVAIGGGTGLSMLLRGLKQHTGNLTAIVTVADDGGSSGKLRRSLGLPPPGDLRNCLAALSDDEDLLTQLFQYRFGEGVGLDGHSFGNLLIAALAGVTGSFDRGILEAGRVLAIRGQVLPSTLTSVDLVADKTRLLDAQSIRVQGESHIPDVPGRVLHVHLEPNEPAAFPEAIRCCLSAELIVIGPGSLYTSILPNLLVPDIAHAVRASRALRVYVCNVATQPGETDDYDCAAHLAAIEAHVGKGLIDVVVVNNVTPDGLPEAVHIVQPSGNGALSVPVYATGLVDTDRPWRHDAGRLADALIRLLEERTGPLEGLEQDQSESAQRLN